MKDGNAAITGSGRKTSISGHLGSFGTTTSSTARPGPRRREASESFNGPGPGPLSPTGNSKFFRDEPSTTGPPASLLRRRTDFRDDMSESPNDQRDLESASRESQGDLPTAFAPLKRSTTGGPLGGALGASPAAPWAAGVQSGGT